MKICAKCLVPKEEINFKPHGKYLYSYCHDCNKIFKKEEYLRNKLGYLRRASNRRKNKPELIKKTKQEWYQKVKYTKKFIETRQRNKKKYLATLRGKLHNNFSCLLRNSIHDKGGKSWQQLVGYTVEDLKFHLEKQFRLGMSWENYGKWHIDHIRPICSFSISSYHDSSFKECWSLNNLRPLWARDNIIKSSIDRKMKIV